MQKHAESVSSNAVNISSRANNQLEGFAEPLELSFRTRFGISKPCYWLNNGDPDPEASGQDDFMVLQSLQLTEKL